ncbi:MAG: COG4315 family predicted lipoprotein [Gaiellaceae bacterium]
MRGKAIRWVLPLALLATAGVGAAMAATTSMHASAATVKTVKSAKYGMVLVSSSGRTLYRYTPDRKGVNKCTPVAGCAKFWPRLLMKGAAKPTAGPGAKVGLLGTIKQPKGLRQVTYARFPLYTFAGDKKAGDVKGEGFEGKWYLVNTSGALVKHAVASSAAKPAPTTTTGGSTWG